MVQQYKNVDFLRLSYHFLEICEKILVSTILDRGNSGARVVEFEGQIHHTLRSPLHLVIVDRQL